MEENNNMKLKALFWYFILFSIGFGNAHAIAIVKIDSASVGVDESVEVDITAVEVVDLANFNILVSYSPSVMTMTGAVNNPVFETDLNNFQRAKSGYVNIANFNFGSGQSGEVLISTLTLKAVGNPGDISDLNIKVITLADPPGNTIPATTQNGTFEIKVPLTSTTFSTTTSTSTTSTTTTSSSTTSPPPTTLPANEAPQPTKTPFLTRNKGLLVVMLLGVILLLAYLYKNRGKDQNDNSK
jgi:hypothetical protein